MRNLKWQEDFDDKAEQLEKFVKDIVGHNTFWITHRLSMYLKRLKQDMEDHEANQD